jgi:hypothetical protein
LDPFGVFSRKLSRLYELSRQKILERSPRKLEKPAFVADITTETSWAGKSDPADRFLPVRSEIFIGQKFPVRKLVCPDFFAAKVFPTHFFRLES